MRYLAAIAALALAFCTSPQPRAEPEPETETGTAASDAFLDPIVEAPQHYALEFDNDYVRVLRENLDAGEAVVMHSHRDRVSVYLRDSQVELRPRGGEPVQGNVVAGAASWTDELTHEGVTKSPVENLSIELKELTGAAIPAPEQDAVLVDPEQHTVDFENDRVRVVRMIYPGSSTTTRHAHRAGFGVALTPVHVQNITDDGEVVIEYEAGATFWSNGGAAHMTKNLRDEELVILLVEMKKEPS